MKRAVLVLAGATIILVLSAYLLGLSAPVDHVATVSLRVVAPKASVWSAIHDIGAWPSWRPSVESAEDLGEGRWRIRGRDGVITYSVDSPSEDVLVTTIADDDLPFGGRWIWTVTAGDGSTLVAIREEGSVHSPWFRFFSKYVFGHESSMRAALRDLEKHLAD